MFSREVSLNEEFVGLRNPTNVLTPLAEIYGKLSEVYPEINGIFPDVEKFFREFIMAKNIGVVFSHNSERYLYRTTEEFRPEHGSNQTYLKQTEHVLNLGDCLRFFRAFAELQFAIASHNSSDDWYSHMNTLTIWQRATPTDLQNPVLFMNRMRAEIEHVGLAYPTWTDIGGVDSRDGSKQIAVLDSVSQASYVEGPRTLHIGVFDPTASEFPSVENCLHSVIYGIDSPNEATIYSVQLDAVEGTSVGRAREYRINLKILVSFMNSYFPGEIDVDALMQQYDSKDLDSILQKINTFSGRSVHKVSDKALEVTLGQIRTCIQNIEKFNKLIPVFESREQNLSTFNNISGGAGMVSLATALALFKKEGISRIRFPTHLPFVQHTGIVGSTTDFQGNLLEQLVSRLQIFAGYSDAVQVSEDESTILLDLTNWDISLQSVNKKNRQLVGLFAAIRTGLTT